MWYLIQITITLWLAYVWCTAPGNSPENLGHGLFLGGLVAWWVTAVSYALVDAIRQFRARRATLTDADQAKAQLPEVTSKDARSLRRLR